MRKAISNINKWYFLILFGGSCGSLWFFLLFPAIMGLFPRGTATAEWLWDLLGCNIFIFPYM